MKHNKQELNKQIEKQELIIFSLKKEKQQIVNETILNHSVVKNIDTQIWKQSEKLMELYDELRIV